MQLRGPYRLWRHTHTFVEVDGGTRIVDDVEYTLPFGWLGALAHPFVARDVAGIFDYRTQAVRAALIAP